MHPKPLPSDTDLHLVELTEWDEVGPEKVPGLKGCSLASEDRAQRAAEALRGRIDIQEGYGGLRIISSSFVGRVDVGPLRISIRPKLAAMPLTQLLRYAYGLRDIGTLDKTRSPTAPHGLHDLLVELLAAEAEELIQGGLARRFVRLAANLDSPRGRILIDQIVRQGGVREARLPCLHFERQADWHLNQVLRAGLASAARIATDRDLRQRVHRLAEAFGDVGRMPSLDTADIERAESELTRLTAAYRAALTIIRLLHDAQGLAFDASQQSSATPGFLFDMNVFFQRLLSRFLHDNLVGAHISDELPIRSLFSYAPGANPKRRRAPTMRPDFALFREGALCGLLDAKYRDIWERGFSAEWLYQLSIYALASPSLVSVLLYASMSPDACDEQIDVRQPLPFSDKEPASVILRPVSLPYLAELLGADKARERAGERRLYAKDLVGLGTHKRALAHPLGKFRAA